MPPSGPPPALPARRERRPAAGWSATTRSAPTWPRCSATRCSPGRRSTSWRSATARPATSRPPTSWWPPTCGWWSRSPTSTGAPPSSSSTWSRRGTSGLMQAVKKYDPWKGVKLSSYAAWWIRAYIIRFIMENWRMVKLGTTQAQRKLFFNLSKEREQAAGPRHRADAAAAGQEPRGGGARGRGDDRPHGGRRPLARRPALPGRRRVPPDPPRPGRRRRRSPPTERTGRRGAAPGLPRASWRPSPRPSPTRRSGSSSSTGSCRPTGRRRSRSRRWATATSSPGSGPARSRPSSPTGCAHTSRPEIPDFELLGPPD